MGFGIGDSGFEKAESPAPRELLLLRIPNPGITIEAANYSFSSTTLWFV